MVAMREGEATRVPRSGGASAPPKWRAVRLQSLAREGRPQRPARAESPRRKKALASRHSPCNVSFTRTEAVPLFVAHTLKKPGNRSGRLSESTVKSYWRAVTSLNAIRL